MNIMNQEWQPALPYELVEATEHHGPYVCTAFGTTVCDYYAMSNPSVYSVRNGGESRPISFTDAAEHAAFMVKAANAHDELLDLVDRLTDVLTEALWVCNAEGIGPEDDVTAPLFTRAAALLAKHGGVS